MSSPAGLQYSQADFLARWMPSSTRAGVILSPSPDLAGPLGHTSAVGSSPMLPDDSFASDFAPLPASTDSSCLGVDAFRRAAGGEMTESDRPVNGLNSVPTRIADGQLDTLDEMASKSQDLPLMMKLEQLKKWQQHMQEQLKAHQLEELLHLQEEQQKLLGTLNGSEHCTGESSEMSGPEWVEDTLHRSCYTQRSYSPDTNHRRVPQGSTIGRQPEQQLSLVVRHEQLPKGQASEEGDHEEEGSLDSREDEEEHSVNASCFSEEDDMLMQHNAVARTEDDSRTEDKIFHDRPIRPGIGGQKQTFEELLEEQLKLEEQRLKSAQQQQSQDGANAAQALPKRAFLKRGEGLSRFTNNRKAMFQKTDVKDSRPPPPQARVISRSNSEPAYIQKGAANSAPRLPVQRKTATLNKENRLKGLSSPPHDTRAVTKVARTKVLGSHQRQNTTGPESVQTDPGGRPAKHQLGKVLPVQAVKVPCLNIQPCPTTKQGGKLGQAGTAENEKSCGSKVESAEAGGVSKGGDPVIQDSFELSFQKKLQRWECDRQLESMELGEFELLEQAAEELSFSSNSSFVMKVLQMDQQRQLQTVKGLHQRRLSSTPIKSPPKGAFQRCNSVGNTGGLACESNSLNSEAFVKTRNDILENKESIKETQGIEREDKHDISDTTPCSRSECGDDKVVKSSLCFPAPINPPYDKRSYEDEDSFRDSSSDVAEENDVESKSVHSNSEDSTLIEGKDGEQGRVVFDDDDTWNDLEDTAIGTADESKELSPISKPTAREISPPQKTLLRKVAVSKGVELGKATGIGSVSLEPDHPPASQLMTKLFPSLKPKAQSAPLPLPPAASVESKKPEEDTGQQVQSRQLRERLAELEIEIERFRKENVALTKLRQENEKKQETLRSERLEFEQMRAEEMAKFEEYKKEETRKLQKERKLFEKHVSAARAIPDKKEREEIQELKQQLSSLQEEMKRRESRWSSTQSRLRQQIDSLRQENSSLRDEIHVLEKLRLSAWKKNPAAAEKESPRMFENNTPPVTKGVKFASPLDSRGSDSSPPHVSSAPATRGNSRDGSQGAAGIKSSLRKPAGPGSSSTSVASRKSEERSAPAGSQENSPNQEHLYNCSPNTDSPTNELELSKAEETESTREVITHPDGKLEKVLVSGDRLIVYPNGTRKEVSADGLTVKVIFFNGDTKQVTADQRVVYYYAETQTTHITYPDGMEVLHFANNQTEKHFPDGRKEITFPDQTVKNLFPNGREESVLTDGTIIQVNSPEGDPHSRVQEARVSRWHSEDRLRRWEARNPLPHRAAQDQRQRWKRHPGHQGVERW
ncbi:centrosomal P4.1-associated protein isoform X2 [Maylandia zebra]|uniref:centrosomal P4.1-associated protein isoform X2 n=1 Tax=Maylandia zebra TaxID=106582 RepID=UPI00403C39F4